MDDLKETLQCAAIYVFFGASAMAGMKAADWMIPDPPRVPVKVEVREAGKATAAPAQQGKRPYIIGLAS